MRRPTRKSLRASGVLAGNLMLAPAVIALRAPLLAIEASEMNPWRVETVRAVTEKAAAMAEGMFAAQMSLMWAASSFWLELYGGRTPSLLNGAALERAAHLALRPSGKRVKGNFNRLRPKR